MLSPAWQEVTSELMSGNETETYLAQTLHMAAGVETYDTLARALLADKQILAWILQYTVAEFRDMSISDITACIGEDIVVGNTPIDPGLTNLGRVQETRTEDNVPGEGTIFFDIRFSAYPQKAGVKLLINMEAQKSSTLGDLHYHLENRIVFYLSRMISAQKNTEFWHSDYDSLKKVRSIWICMNRKKDGDSIEEIHLVRNTVFGRQGNPHTLDLLQGIIINIRIGENMDVSSCALISMLEVLFSRRSVAEKKNILEKEYGIVMTVELEGRLNTMCNFSECIMEMALEQGLEQGLKQGREQGELNCSRQSIFDLLEDLGDIPNDIHTRIQEEKNTQILRRWLKLAARTVSFDAFRESLNAALSNTD